MERPRRWRVEGVLFHAWRGCLFVGKSVDGIFAGRFPCRIERAEHGSDKSEDNAADDPRAVDDELKCREFALQDCAEQIACGHTYGNAYGGEHHAFAQDDVDDVSL